AGHALNGFSYVANRWGWAFCLAGAAVVALRWDALTKLSGKQAIILCALTAVYVAACFLLNDDKALRFWYGVIALFWFVVTLIVALASYAHYHSPTKVHRTFAHATLCAVACAGIILNAYVVYLPAGGNYISLYLEQKELDSIYDTEAHAIDALGDQDFFRYSGTVTLATRNAGALTGISSTSSYWSLTNASMTVFLKELGVDGSDNAAACRYNLNGQSMLNELLGVKYYVTTPKGALPYAYKHVPLESKVLYTPQNNNEHKYGIYENTKPLPFGFTYQETVSKASYDELSPEEKREMVLQASTVVKDGADAVADTDTDNALPNTNNTNNLRFSCYDVPFVIDELEGQEGLSVENGVVKTGKGAQTVTLRVDGKKNVETTVQFTNLVLESKSTTEASIALTYHFSDGSTQKGRISIYSPRDSFYEPWPWKIYCPGFVESPLESIEIEFPTKCTYTWDKLQLIAQPMDSYDSYVDALTEDTLENLDFHYFSGDIAASNCITGDVSLDQAKVLCTQIPYSKGWSLRVDGTETDVLQVNTMLCGVMLEPGEHVIEFRYQTPGLVAGCVLSLLGLCAFVVLAFLQRRASGKAHGKHSA
ncbi:MAG: YfhO family protein, partial [Eggerthellaceae bacterium]|nr:YfhO family protein [Eggerthellaceae bacterium]